MSLDIGKLVAYLDLDESNFDRKTEKARKQIEGLILHMKTLEKVKPDLNLKVTAKTEELDALQLRLGELKAQAAKGIDVRADVGETMLKLAAVRAEISAMHTEALKAFDPKTSNLEKYAKSLDNLGGKLRGLKVPGGFIGTLAALGPTLIPAGNATIGVLGGLAAGAIETAGAVGVLSLAFKGANTAATAYQAYQTALLKATTGKQRTAALNTLNASAYGQASSGTQTFARFEVNQLKPFGGQLTTAAQNGLLPGLTLGLGSVLKDAPQIKGAIHDIANSMGVLFAQAGRGLNSPFWRQWLVFFGRDSAKNVQTMGHTLGQVFEGIARAMQRSAPQTHNLLEDVDKLATRFNHWTAGRGFADFLHRADADGHQVASTLVQIWHALEPILQGAGAAGRTELTLIGGTFSLISHLPTDWLVAAGHYLPLIFLAAKVGAPAMNLLGIGMQSVSKNLATMAEEGATKTELLKAGFLGSARAIAGPAGAGLIIDSLTRTSSSFSTMESVAGGALAGFSVGGPWGAAIGSILGLGAAMWKAGDAATTNYAEIAKTRSLQEAKTAIDNVSDSLNTVTGKYTAATRAAVLMRLQTDPGGKLLLAAAAGANIPQAEVVNDILHGGKPVRKLQRAIDSYSNTGALGQKIAADQAAAAASPSPKTAQALAEDAQALKDLNNAFPGALKNLVDGNIKARALADATGNVVTNLGLTNKQFAAFPKSVQTVLELKNRPETLGQLRGIASAIEGIGPISRRQAISLVDALLKASPQIVATKTEIQGIVDALSGIHPKKVAVSVQTSQASHDINNLALQLSGLGALIPVFNHPTKNTPSGHKGSKKPGANAYGTNFWGGGSTWVGERGPELINLPRGTQVIPASRSAQMATAGAAPGGGPSQVHLSDQSIAKLAQAIVTHTSSTVLNELEFAGGY